MVFGLAKVNGKKFIPKKNSKYWYFYPEQLIEEDLFEGNV